MHKINGPDIFFRQDTSMYSIIGPPPPPNQFFRTDYTPVQIGNTFALTVLLMCMIVYHTVV